MKKPRKRKPKQKWILDMDDISKSSPIDTKYSCVMQKPTQEHKLHAVEWSREVPGRFVTIPSRRLFVTPDGEIYATSKRRDGKIEFAPLSALLAILDTVTILESFSKPPDLKEIRK